MAPILWALGGALAMYLTYRQSPRSTPATTKTAAAVHGELMANCIEPQKLVRAAAFFGQEGMTHHAQALLHKAKVIHEMLHGAKAIVERCRAGDQHAMAMAKAIGERCRAGDKRAQLSAALIKEYSNTNPPPATTPEQVTVPAA